MNDWNDLLYLWVVIIGIVIMIFVGKLGWNWHLRRRGQQLAMDGDFGIGLGFGHEEDEWWEKVVGLRHLLKGDTWQNPKGKINFFRAVFNGVVPRYLVYLLGDVTPTESDLAEIAGFCWGDVIPRSNDWQIIENFNDLGRALLIKNAKYFWAQIVVGGRTCSLIQMGSSDLQSRGIDVIYFPDLFKRELARV
jgi:hypothetical protein